MHTLTLSVPNAYVEVFSDGLQDLAAAVAAHVNEHAGEQEITLYFETPPDKPAITARLALLTEVTGAVARKAPYASLPVTDWLSHVYRGLHPLHLGRFYVYGSHSAEAPPAAAIPIRVDAATAFGSGHHATTAACLIALSEVAKNKIPLRMLDLGCGSGILAMGMAKLFRKRLLALDTDPEAVRVTTANAHLNGCAAMIDAAVGGSDSPTLKSRAPYDLVTANILARPLAQMAHELSAALAPGGMLILSGLLTKQERLVINAYLPQGLALVKIIRREEWSALILKRPYAPVPKEVLYAL